jgi:hypothetical protein
MGVIFYQFYRDLIGFPVEKLNAATESMPDGA